MRKFHRQCKTCENCEDCGKHCSDFRMIAVDSRKCVKCANAQKRRLCKVCGKYLPESDYPSGSIWNASASARSPDLRCTLCHTCVSCNLHKSSRAFDGKAATCIQCVKRSSTYVCDACGLSRVADQFAQTQLFRAHHHQARRVCVACTEIGYSSRDVQAYPCVGCGNKGHLEFPRDALKNYKRPHRHLTLKCRDCSSRCVPRICDACGHRKDADPFARTSMRRATQRAAHLVCLACAAMGYSDCDVQG